MSYLVLARKYRPSTFAEVVGQDHVTRTLGNAFAAGRVHHAFLFCGPRGCGKTTLARIVGKALNCEARVPGSGTPVTAEPCGVCSACVSISNGSSVDYQEMDGASNRGIDAIRELTEAVRYQPAVLRKKVYVIDEVHMLTTEAFNALLKTLEEPPPHVTFVLATTEPHKLPNTILSRCQRYDFKLVSAPRLAQHLTGIFASEQLAVEPGALSLVVRESGGSVRDALSLCDQLISYVGDAALTERHVAEVLGVADRSLTRSLVQALAHGDAGAALAAVESAIERGVDEVQLARAIVRYLRDLSVLQVAPDRAGLVDATDEELAELRREAGAIERSRVTQMFERMLRCCDELGKTLQPRLVLDCALIDVATVEPLVPLGDLIERLGELEARLAGRAARPSGLTGHSGNGSSGNREPARATGTPRGPAGPANPTSPAPPRRADAPVAAQSPTGAHAPTRTAEPAAAYTPTSSHAPPHTAEPAAAYTPTSSHAPPHATEPAAAYTPTSSHAPPHATEPAAAHTPTSSHAPPHATEPAAHGTPRPTSAGEANLAVRPSQPVPSAARESSQTARPVDSAAPIAGGAAVPIAMQPSGPVPKPEAVAAGSGPHDPAPSFSSTTTMPAAPAIAAPAAPAAQAPRQLAIPDSPAEALRAWGDVLAAIEERRPSLHAQLHHARVMSWTRELIELGFPVEMHSIGEMAKDSTEELGAIIRAMGPELRALKVRIRLLDASESSATSARSVLEASRERSSAERNKREAEARAHPITKHVLQTFGAQIKEIKTDV
jgi:DNA polymerase-3 subunit gamma/tau